MSNCNRMSPHGQVTPSDANPSRRPRLRFTVASLVLGGSVIASAIFGFGMVAHAGASNTLSANAHSIVLHPYGGCTGSVTPC